MTDIKFIETSRGTHSPVGPDFSQMKPLTISSDDPEMQAFESVWRKLRGQLDEAWGIACNYHNEEELSVRNRHFSRQEPFGWDIVRSNGGIVFSVRLCITEADT